MIQDCTAVHITVDKHVEYFVLPSGNDINDSAGISIHRALHVVKGQGGANQLS